MPALLRRSFRVDPQSRRVESKERRHSMEEIEYLHEEADTLTDEEKILICQCINNYGEADHPWADNENIRHFERSYAITCVTVAYYSGNMSEQGRSLAESVVAKLPDKKGGVN
jgi:hypothetical protein